MSPLTIRLLRLIRIIVTVHPAEIKFLPIHSTASIAENRFLMFLSLAPDSHSNGKHG